MSDTDARTLRIRANLLSSGVSATSLLSDSWTLFIVLLLSDFNLGRCSVGRIAMSDLQSKSKSTPASVPNQTHGKVYMVSILDITQASRV